jgi:hypothetical protein
MSTAVFRMKQPKAFALPDGGTFEASKIAVLDEDQPAQHTIHVYGVLKKAGELTARILVIFMDATVDLNHYLPGIVKEQLTAGNYSII